MAASLLRRSHCLDEPACRAPAFAHQSHDLLAREAGVHPPHVERGAGPERRAHDKSLPVSPADFHLPFPSSAIQ